MFNDGNISDINSYEELQRPFFGMTDQYMDQVSQKIVDHYKEEYGEGNTNYKLSSVGIVKIGEEQFVPELDEYSIKFRVNYTYEKFDNENEWSVSENSFTFDFDQFNNNLAEFEDDLFEKLECELEKEGF